jgi:predicted nucleic acid-binding protein
MIVVDTNVITYLWVPGAQTPVAEQLLGVDADWAAPPLWRSEFRSVLAVAVKRRTLNLERAVQMARGAEDQFKEREFPVDAAHVLMLAATSGCSTYDCEFVALARDLGVPLVTNDREVLKAFPAVAVPLDRYS